MCIRDRMCGGDPLGAKGQNPRVDGKGLSRDVEKLKKYYSKWATFEIVPEVEPPEKKFKRLRTDTPYLF